MMTRNVHNIDRIARIVLGLALIVAAFSIHWLLGVVGVILLATGLVGWCPIYRVLGISTCRVPAHS